jgi:hypothetical protein
MVRRRSTVRFRNGAPAQGSNSNILNLLGGHSGGQVDPVPAKAIVVSASRLFLAAELCASGGCLDLLDCPEDYRRGALHGPAHQVPGTVALLYLREPPVG